MLVFVAVVARSPRSVRFASTTRFPRTTTRLPSSRDGALGDGRRSYPRRPGPLDGRLENEGGAFEEDGRRSYPRRPGPLDGRSERGGGYSNPRDRQGSDLPPRSAPAPLRRDPAGDSPAPRARSSELYNRYNRDLRTGAEGLGLRTALKLAKFVRHDLCSCA